MLLERIFVNFVPWVPRPLSYQTGLGASRSSAFSSFDLELLKNGLLLRCKVYYEQIGNLILAFEWDHNY